MVSPFIKQAWTVSAVMINIAGLGMILSFPYCLLPGLRASSSSIKVDSETASWLVSSIGISQLFGFFSSSIVMDWRGRRFAHLLFIAPGVIGWLFIFFATNASMLMCGRIFGGFTAGATVTLGAVVIGEYTSPEYRGVFLNLKTTATCIGATVMHVLGHFYHWRIVSLLALIPMIITFGIVCTWHESPSWLASRKQYLKSEEAFFYLRGRSETSVKEFEAIIWAQKEKTATAPEKRTMKEQMLGLFNKFTQKDFLKPMMISVFGFLLLEACGRHTFPSYASDFIGNINGDKSQSFYYTIAIDLIITLSTSFSCILVKIMKRRTLLFFSGLSSLFVMINIIIYTALASKAFIADDKPWIPLTMLVIYFILANLGCTPIPLALLGEIFPLAHKGVGSSISGLAISLMMILALKTTPALLVSIKIYGTFTVYAIAMAGSLLYLYFTLPETKNRTLQEIEDFFNYGKFIDDKATGALKTEMEIINVNKRDYC